MSGSHLHVRARDLHCGLVVRGASRRPVRYKRWLNFRPWLGLRSASVRSSGGWPEPGGGARHTLLLLDARDLATTVLGRRLRCRSFGRFRYIAGYCAGSKRRIRSVRVRLILI